MQMNQIFLAVLFISMPGILCYFLLKKLIGKFGSDLTDRIISIFLLSIISYLIVDLAKSIVIKFQIPDFRIKEMVINPNSATIADVLSASGVSILLALILSYLHRYKIWNRFAQFINASNRYGDEDVFNFMLDSNPNSINGRWIFVRDHKVNLFYYGYASVWSEAKEKREIVLLDVDVYSNDDAKFLYSTDKVYISRNDDDITIEIPKPQQADPVVSTQENYKEKASE